MKFSSTHDYLQMNTDPVERRVERNGQVFLEMTKGLPIEFKKGKFETNDDTQIAAIKKHPRFGKEIFEVTSDSTVALEPVAPVVPADVPPVDAPQEVPVGTINNIIAYLVTEKQADPSAFAGLKKDELIAYALTTFNVKFI